MDYRRCYVADEDRAGLPRSGRDQRICFAWSLIEKTPLEGALPFSSRCGNATSTIHDPVDRGNVWMVAGVEGEITHASNRIQRSYEGWFVSYADRGATREEIERLAPTARRTLGYAPGLGGSAAFVIRGGSIRVSRWGSAVSVTDRLSVAPEVRYVYGGPARIGQKHRELGARRARRLALLIG